MTARVVVVGSLNYDLVTQVSSVPQGGETVKAAGFATHRGGKGANQALALRRLVPRDAASVAMVGCVGSDTFGRELLDGLRQEGVDTQHVAVLDDERTGVATILVEDSGENRILVYGGANDRAEAGCLDAGVWRDAAYVVLQNEIPLATTLQVLREAAVAGGPRTVLNPSPLPELPLSEWPHIDVLVVNESEAAALTGRPVTTEQEAREALPRLQETAGLVVITLGARGVVWHGEDGAGGYVPATKVAKVVDTTGAGDTFLAAFVSQLLDPALSMEQRLQFAVRAAGIAVTRAGAASSVPTLAEVLQK